MCLFSGQSMGQYLTGHELLSKAKMNAINTYHSNIKFHSGLYNGKKYLGDKYFFQNNGHPFFISKQAIKGSVVYDGVLYSDITLLYDEVLGELVFKDFSKKIQLLKNLVTEFSVAGHSFVNIISDQNLVENGYYQKLNIGHYSVLKMEKKVILEDISSARDGIKRSIIQNYIFLIKQGDVYHPIKKKKDLLSITTFTKKETQELIKSKRLKFKKNRSALLIEVCQYYNRQISGK